MKRTPRQLASQLRRDAKEYERQFASDPDPEYRRTILADLAALHAVADLLDRGDVRGAYRRAARLDTVVREAISTPVWNALSGGNAYGHTEHDR